MVPAGAVWIPPDPIPGDSAAADSGWGRGVRHSGRLSLGPGSGPWEDCTLPGLASSPAFPSTPAPPGPDLLGHRTLPGAMHATSLPRRKSAPIWVRMSARVLGGLLPAPHLLLEATAELSQLTPKGRPGSSQTVSHCWRQGNGTEVTLHSAVGSSCAPGQITWPPVS